jgi:hypothetical protein
VEGRRLDGGRVEANTTPAEGSDDGGRLLLRHRVRRSALTQQPDCEHGGHEHDQGTEEGDNGQGNGPDAVG